MDLQPAHFDQVRRTEDGDWIVIGADSSTAVADLQAIDKGFRVRLAGLKTSKPYFVVYHEKVEGDTTTHTMVTTVQAHQNSFGVWEGLDQRVVAKIRKIGSRDYNYVRELEKREEARKKRKSERFAETLGPVGEKAAWALRKDLQTHTNRAFIRNGIPK